MGEFLFPKSTLPNAPGAGPASINARWTPEERSEWNHWRWSRTGPNCDLPAGPFLLYFVRAQVGGFLPAVFGQPSLLSAASDSVTVCILRFSS